MALIRHKAFSSHGGAVVGHIVFDDLTGAVTSLRCTTGPGVKGRVFVAPHFTEIPAQTTDGVADITGLGLLMAKGPDGLWEPRFDYSFGSAPETR